ncbi:MAG: YkgJ family cysteine cluster protein [Candidatus Methanoperedens sp.]|nr:YkgJ family cysteine cluster protein [Candidatus Methanoperedens sp.]
MKTTCIKTDEIEHEISGIIDFPDDRFEEIIREVGFVCDLCGRCCTREFNDHVFLLDDDAKRIIEVAGREVLRPAPYYEFCDNLGRFYVMGYALRNKSNGDCIFYLGGRCDHYADRPEICRIFPYMLHREEDDEGNLDWRQIGGLNQHGLYHGEVGVEEAGKIAGNVKRYEIAFLKQKLAFLNKIEEHFKKHGLKHSQQIYDRKMRELKCGGEIEVYVFQKGNFIKEKLSI